MSAYQLKDYQKEDVSTLASVDKCFLALEQGLGKTAVSLTDAQGVTLVVCPATLKINWTIEAAIWRGDFKPQIIVNKRTPIDSACNLFVVNYDILGGVVRRLPSNIETLIVDESHYCKNPKALRTKIVSKLIRKIPRVRLLSGTPVINRPMDLFPMLKAIGAIKMDYVSFGRRFCAGWTTPWGSFDVSGSSNLEELYKKLEPVMIRRTKKSALPELPEKSFRILELDLPVDKREKQFAKTSIKLSDHKVSFQSMSDILKMNAQRKLNLAVEHIRNVLESQEKIVVFAWHTEIIEQLAERLAEFDPVVIFGQTKMTMRQSAVDEFQKGKSRVFIGNIKAAGVGITLTAASYVVFVETTWTPTDLDQCADRCLRIGQTEHVHVDILTIHKSIDAQQLHKMLEKMEVINSLVKEKSQENYMKDSSALLKNLIESAEALVEAIDAAKELLSSEQADQPEKPARTSRSEKAEKSAQSAQSARSSKAKQVEEADDEDDEADKAPPRKTKQAEKKSGKKAVTLDDVREKAADAIEEKGEDFLFDLFEEYGIEKLSELEESQYAEFISGLS